MELFPNAVSFRVITTLDVLADDEIPRGFTGRVRHVEDGRITSISWYQHGLLENPSRRTPAYVRLRSNGTIKQERYYESGRLHDPAPTMPAVRGYFANGAPRYAEHYRHGRRQNGPDGAPAITKWRLDGSVRSEVRYPERGQRRPTSIPWTEPTPWTASSS